MRLRPGFGSLGAEFYTFRVGDRRLRDRVADLAGFKEVEDVTCSDCAEAELVEQAAEGS